MPKKKQKIMLSTLIRKAEEALTQYGDMPVTVPDWMSEGSQLEGIDEVGVMTVSNHPIRAYLGRAFMVHSTSGKAVRVFNICSHE